MVLLLAVAGLGAAAEADENPLFLGATMTYSVPADVTALDVQVPQPPPGSTPVDGCAPGNVTRWPSDQGFRFSETSEQNGCAEVRLTVPVPDGAESFRVHFLANRQVVQPTTRSVAVDMVQELHLYRGERTAKEVSHTVFDPHTDSMPTSQPFEFAFDAEDATELTLAWYFEDRGASVGQDVANPVLGQRFRAAVLEVELEFVGIPVDVEDRSLQRATRGGLVEERFEVEMQVPEEIHAGGQASIDFLSSNRLEVRRVAAPGGHAIPDQALEQTATQGVLHVRLPKEVVAQHGPGAYTVQYAAVQAIEARPFMFPVLIGLMAAPVYSGVSATRDAVRFEREAPPRVGQRTRRMLTASLAAVALLYAMLTAWIVTGRRWTGLSAWPMLPDAVVVAGLLVACTVAFLLVGLLYRRQLSSLLEEDREHKQRMNRTLRTANRELERVNRELEQFASVAGHDLKEPLRKIVTYNQILQRSHGDQLDDDARELLEITVDAGQRMQQLVEDLLAYSRIGREGLEKEPVDLDDLLDEVLEDLQGAIEDADAKLTVGRMPEVQGVPSMLRELLQNLVGNALKYRKRGHPVDVHVDAERRGGNWRIAVRDNGIGMDPEHRHRVFEVFQRLHGREEYAGTGVGLAICKKIVEHHGGEIGVESEPGQGSTFWFTLPA